MGDGGKDLAEDEGAVDCAVAPVGDGLWGVEGPGAVFGGREVAGVGAQRCEAVLFTVRDKGRSIL